MINTIDYMAFEYVESEFQVNFGARSASEWRFTQILSITKFVCQMDSTKELYKQFNLPTWLILVKFTELNISKFI